MHSCRDNHKHTTLHTIINYFPLILEAREKHVQIGTDYTRKSFTNCIYLFCFTMKSAAPNRLYAIASNGVEIRWIMNWKGSEWKRSWYNWRHYVGTCLERRRKTMKNFRLRLRRLVACLSQHGPGFDNQEDNSVNLNWRANPQSLLMYKFCFYRRQVG